MYNARSFLEDSEYVSWEVKKQQRAQEKVRLLVQEQPTFSDNTPVLQPDAPKETMIEIKRKFGRSKPVVYQITDKAPPKKSPVRYETRPSSIPPSLMSFPGLGEGGCSARAGLRMAVEGVSVQGASRCWQRAADSSHAPRPRELQKETWSTRSQASVPSTFGLTLIPSPSS